MTNSKSLKTMTLDELRGEIDRLDEELVRLLCERAATALEIGRNKVRSNSPFQNAEREKQVLGRVKSLNEGPLGDASLEAIYREIMNACTKVQENTIIVSPDED